MTQAFYDQLAPFYHLLYPDWEASVARQSQGIATVLEEFGFSPGARILDAACGIGTQTLGLARLGYDVTASDLSPDAVARARVEANRRDLQVTFAVADLRHLSTVFTKPFAAVIACDNAVPHLLTLQLIQQCGAEPPVVREFHSRYYAVELPTLERLLRETGFDRITRRDEHFFQPLLVAFNAPA